MNQCNEKQFKRFFDSLRIALTGEFLLFYVSCMIFQNCNQKPKTPVLTFDFMNDT